MMREISDAEKEEVEENYLGFEKNFRNIKKGKVKHSNIYF